MNIVDIITALVQAVVAIICIIMFGLTMVKAFEVGLRYWEYGSIEQSREYRKLYSAWEKARKYGAATSKRRHWE